MTSPADASDTVGSAAPGPWFYGLAVLLMAIGVAAAFVQKGHESAAAQSVARQIASGITRTDADRTAVEQTLAAARGWTCASFMAVFLAIVAWAVAVKRHEKRRGSWIVIVALFALYVGLQWLMV